MRVTQNDLVAFECSVVVVLNEFVFNEFRLCEAPDGPPPAPTPTTLAPVPPPTPPPPPVPAVVVVAVLLAKPTVSLVFTEPVINDDEVRLLFAAAAAAAAAACLKLASSADDNESLSDSVPISESK